MVSEHPHTRRATIDGANAYARSCFIVDSSGLSSAERLTMQSTLVGGTMLLVGKGASLAPERVGRRAMVRTPVCDLLGMEVPIMQAAIWPATAPEPVAAVSEAGGLGRASVLTEAWSSPLAFPNKLCRLMNMDFGELPFHALRWI